MMNEDNTQDLKAIRAGYLFITGVVILVALVLPVVIHAISLEARPVVFIHR